MCTQRDRSSCPGSENLDDKKGSPVQVRLKHEEFREKVKLPGYADNSCVCRGNGIEPLHAEENFCTQEGLTTRTCIRLDMSVELVLAETCESRDESPSSNRAA